VAEACLKGRQKISTFAKATVDMKVKRKKNKIIPLPGEPVLTVRLGG